ncbi:hypothetical protein DY000_02059490 [Brassica cretica]|uniref:DUF7865 domain-containing protein n=4 Tax=Brassica TaxID=3705 RepID=A0ABQ7AR73_BRACR|nr:hypothetical protein DY000_02059490 [Brassica cretica]
MTTSASMNPSLFRVICILHSVIALTSGTLMMFYTEKASIFGPGSEIASKLKGSTPHDELLIQISQSFSGLLLFAIGLILFMVSFVKDREFHSFFAGGSVILYVLMASWRVLFEWKIEDLAYEWPKQALGDIALGISWVFFLVYSWREKFSLVLRCSTPPPLSRSKSKPSACGRVARGEFVGPKGRGFDPLPQICPSVWPGNWVSNSHSNKWAASRRGVSPLGMSGLQAQERACSLSQPSKDVAAAETKPKKRICCACPDTKKLRDECIVENGESACTKWIEAHRMCLRSEGFKV